MVTAVGQATWRALLAGANTLTARHLEALSPLVVLAPHADDETLGCGGLLATASSLGLRPRVVFLTDGAASHKGSPTWSGQRLARVRKDEALAALDVLGVSQHQTLFLGWPDSEPFDAGAPARSASVARLLAWFQGFQPKSLWAPWPQEAHCDHEAAAELAASVAEASAAPLRRMDYIVWGWRSERLLEGCGGDLIWALPCAEHVERRRRALSRHRTQTSELIPDAAQSFLIPPELAALTDRPAEIFLERR